MFILVKNNIIGFFRKTIVPFVLLCLFFCFLMYPFMAGLSKHLIHVDEGAWIATSLYKCKILFMDRNFNSSLWEDSYFHNLPPIATYIIGFTGWQAGFMDDMIRNKPPIINQ